MTLNKKSIKWYEEGLKNTKDYLEREVQLLEQQKLKVDGLIKSVERKTKQIEFAKSKRMTEFDEDSKVFMRIE